MNFKLLIRIAAFVLLILAGPSNARNLGKSEYEKKVTADLSESKVNWTGKKPAGEHHGYVKLSGGEILLDKNEITGGSFTIDLNTIANTDQVDESFRGKLIGHLKSQDFFDVAKHPTAKFVITRIERIPNHQSGTESRKATHRIEGNLTMKGITKKISFDASINLLNGKLTASSVPFAIDRTQWGVNYQSKRIFPSLKDEFIYDDIILKIDLVSN